MPKPAMDDATRLAGLREVIRAANGDWHDATALWSVQADLDWLLARATPPEPAGLDAAVARVTALCLNHGIRPNEFVAAVRGDGAATPPEPAGLDVERLARAIPTADLRIWFERIHGGDGRQALAESRQLAAFIAEFYDADTAALRADGAER